MQVNYSSQSNVHPNDTESPAANQSISQFYVGVAAVRCSAVISSEEIMLKQHL